MNKPPFQFGLKPVFAATTGAAIWMAVVVLAPRLLLALAALAISVALIFTFGLAFWIVAGLAIRFFEGR